MKNQDRQQVSTTLNDPWLGVALIVLGLGAAAVALLGPLVFEVIEYHASEGAINQIVGGDVAGLLLVAPISISAGLLVLRGNAGGAILGIGPAIYAVYMYTQLALGNDIERYAGNAERFFPLYVVLVILGGGITVRAWRGFGRIELPRAPRRLDKSIGTFLLVVAFFLVFGLHLPGLVDAMSEQPSSSEYLADPVVFWLVKMMDLGFVVPFLVWVGVGLWRGNLSAQRAKYAAVSWAALLGSSVAGMAIVMQATGDSAASVVNTVVFAAFAAVAVGFAVAVYRPVFTSP